MLHVFAKEAKDRFGQLPIPCMRYLFYCLFPLKSWGLLAWELNDGLVWGL